MAPTKTPNGLIPASPSLTSLPPQMTEVKALRSLHSRTGSETIPPPQHLNTSDGDAYMILDKGNFAFANSPQLQQQPPSWNPASLLDPRRNRATTTKPEIVRPSSNGASTSDEVVFQFSNPSNDDLYSQQRFTFSDQSANSSRANTPTNGMGNMIERMNNVQTRSVAPEPKRRKTDSSITGSETKKSIDGGGGGILGDYLKEKRDEGKNDFPIPVAQTVDLTSGIDSSNLQHTLADIGILIINAGTDDDVVIIKDPSNEEVCYGMINAKLDCHKVPSVKPGTQSIFGPTWVPLVKIVLRRISGDKTNIISAYDYTRDIVGNLDASTARGLVGVMDANMRIRTDCRIPSRPKKPDEIQGQPISRTYKLDLVLYGPSKFTQSIGKHLQHFGVTLISPNRVDKGIKVQNPHAPEYKPPGPTKSYNIDTSIPTTRTVEEIRTEVMGMFDSLFDSAELPELEADPRILTPLLKHQKQALHFMTAKEKPGSLEGMKANASMWQTRTTARGEKAYYNLVTSTMDARPPPDTRGGILADMMGLGKTLSILSLVSSSLDDAFEWSARTPVQPRAPPQQPHKPGHIPRGNSLDLTKLKLNGKATLLVCPLSTVTNWEEQLKQHIKPESLNYYVYHGSNRVKDVKQLAAYDIVITTYGSISSELNARSRGKSGLFPLEEIGWFRIVLDEAHMIREQSTLQFKAICRLQASRRWAVTGTPVQNRLDDLGALLRFLRLVPFDDRSKFLRYIVEPFKCCDPEIVPKLRILVDSITLRRLKDKIDLPPRTDHIITLDFTPEERHVYDLFARNAQDRVQVLSSAYGRANPLSGHTYIHILRSILRLRLLCAHGKDLLSEEDLNTLQGMTAATAIDLDSDDENSSPGLSDQQAYEMLKLMQDTGGDMCNECGKKLGSSDDTNIESEGQEDLLGYMNPCYHLFCPACIRSFRERAKSSLQPGSSTGQCPLCTRMVRPTFVALHRAKADVENEGPAKSKVTNKGQKTFEGYEGPHTKTKALIEDLLKSKAESDQNPNEPPFKSVVFSGWTSHLGLIQIALNNVGITYTRLDGSMSRTARTMAMDNFREDPSVQVMLVSIMAGGLGLNLTAANNVYVMEPQYNPAAEAQAVDRVHRLGQKRPVRTVRYIMRDSFEEKMLELQDKKTKLASLSMDSKDKSFGRAEAAKQKLMDLRSLFR
jgi:SNF2 family DNA or RNA helicase